MEHNEKSTKILGIMICFRGDAQKHNARISEHKIFALTKNSAFRYSRSMPKTIYRLANVSNQVLLLNII